MYYVDPSTGHDAKERSAYIVHRVGKAYFPAELMEGNVGVAKNNDAQTRTGRTNVVSALKAMESGQANAQVGEKENDEEEDEEDEQFDDESDFEMAAADDDEDVELSDA